VKYKKLFDRIHEDYTRTYLFSNSTFSGCTLKFTNTHTYNVVYVTAAIHNIDRSTLADVTSMTYSATLK